MLAQLEAGMPRRAGESQTAGLQDHTLNYFQGGYSLLIDRMNFQGHDHFQ
jgi:hypothetical protein